MGEENKEFNLKFIKNNWNWILLAIIICFGFYLRAYHLDYPVVGYHNWKETHYLTEARNFASEGFFKHGFFVPEHDYPNIADDPSGVHADTFPITSIITAIAFKLFGPNLISARIINILFSLATVLLFYFVLLQISEKKEIALIGSFFAAICPLFVFFSHNTQLINQGIFFIMLSLLFFLRWRKENSFRDLFLASLFFSLGMLTKYPYGIIAVVFIFLLSLSKIKDILKNVRSPYIILSILILLLIPVWILYMNVFLPKASDNTAGVLSSSLIDIGVLFSSSFWTPFKSYLRDNYTFYGLFLFFLGLLYLFFHYVVCSN